MRSMTGFGRAQARLSDRLAVGLIIRSVNHRYLDVQVRLSGREDLPEVEAAVRGEVEREAERGRITVQVNLQRLKPSTSQILVDREGLSDLMHQLEGLGSAGAQGANVGDLLALPGLVSVTSESAGLESEEIANLRAAVGDAACAFSAMRQEEGQELALQIRRDLGEVESLLD
ncbi:MAG: hypothetical protein K8R59_01985 [Thermoanaerobaculales bacterium]|nr:hypothetical protein [Thermoanaerobaculales bacterium]